MVWSITSTMRALAEQEPTGLGAGSVQVCRRVLKRSCFFKRTRPHKELKNLRNKRKEKTKRCEANYGTEPWFGNPNFIYIGRLHKAWMCDDVAPPTVTLLRLFHATTP